MNPLTESGRQDTNTIVRSSVHSAGSRYQPDHGVVVLGVIYPSVVLQAPQIPSSNMPDAPPRAAEEHPSTEVIFYDPISQGGSYESDREGHLKPVSQIPRTSERKRIPKGSQKARREAIKAVIGDLERLALKKQGS